MDDHIRTMTAAGKTPILHSDHQEKEAPDPEKQPMQRSQVADLLYLRCKSASSHASEIANIAGLDGLKTKWSA